jgi:hypothetical protein
MKRLVITIFVFFIFVSCNPKLHIIGSGMRHHNLSQNKYQPNKHRKKVNIGRNQNSPIFLILRNN